MIFSDIYIIFTDFLEIFSCFLSFISLLLINLTYTYLFFYIFSLVTQYGFNFVPQDLIICIENFYCKNPFFKIITKIISLFTYSIVKICISLENVIASIAIIINNFSQNFFIDKCADKIYFLFIYLIHNYHLYFNWLFNDYNIVFVIFQSALDKSQEALDNLSNGILLIVQIFHNSNDNSDQCCLMEIK